MRWGCLLLLFVIGCSEAAAVSFRPNQRRQLSLQEDFSESAVLLANAKFCSFTSAFSWKSPGDWTANLDAKTNLTIVFRRKINSSSSAGSLLGMDLNGTQYQMSQNYGLRTGSTMSLNQFTSSNGTALSTANTGYVLTDDVWKHYILHVSGSNSFSLWVDGTSATPSSTNTAFPIYTAGSNIFCIGGGEFSGSCLKSNNTFIDELLILTNHGTPTTAEVNQMCCGVSSGCGGTCLTVDHTAYSYYTDAVGFWRCGDGSDTNSALINVKQSETFVIDGAAPGGNPYGTY